MSRVAVALMFAAIVAAGTVRAAEIKGTIKSVDGEKKQVTLTIDGGDKTYQVSENAKVVTMGGKPKKPTFAPVAGGITGLTAGSSVTCFTDGDSADKLLEIRMHSTMKTRKKKDK